MLPTIRKSPHSNNNKCGNKFKVKLSRRCLRYKQGENYAAPLGDARPDSDVDLIVDYDPASGMTMFKFMDLEEELARLFQGMRVDVIPSRGISSCIKDSVLRTARVLYKQ